MNLYAQLFGIIAMLFLINSYFNTKKKKYLFTQILCNIFFAIQYAILNATTAVLNAFIAIIRSISLHSSLHELALTPQSILQNNEITSSNLTYFCILKLQSL